MIFHDDVARYFPDSNLMCLSNTTGASWHYPNGTVVGQIGASSDDYVQIPVQTDVDLLRNKDVTEINPLNNGLWTCRLGDLFIPVGIYPRRGTVEPLNKGLNGTWLFVLSREVVLFERLPI